MFGFGDGWVAAAYLLSIGSAGLCVVYGIMHWNTSDDVPLPVHPAEENLDFEETV